MILRHRRAIISLVSTALLLTAGYAVSATVNPTALPVASASGTDVANSQMTTNGNAISCSLSPGSGQSVHLTGFAVTGSTNGSTSNNATGVVTVTGLSTTLSYQFTLNGYSVFNETAPNELIINYSVPPVSSGTVTVNVPQMGTGQTVVVTCYGVSY